MNIKQREITKSKTLTELFAWSLAVPGLSQNFPFVGRTGPNFPEWRDRPLTLRYIDCFMELFELADAVTDQQSFLRFVKALIADREDEVAKERVSPSATYDTPGANGWYNHTIEDFLECATAWAESTGFGQTQGAPDNLWHRFANFLYCGKIYE
jgi:hypothetical protein